MPQRSKGPRLWPEKRRKDKSGPGREPCWYILDGRTKRSTGIRVENRRKAPAEAEQALADYIADKHTVNRERDRPADAVAVADVINIYLADKGEKVARPHELGMRAAALLRFWGDKRLNDVTGPSCRRYVLERNSQSAARRELEDLRAAIGHHRSEGLCREVVNVILPERGPSRDRWLTRSEAARLIWSAWRFRECQKGHATGRASRKHVARFVLVALYTGTRAGAVCGASLRPAAHTGWVDLERGVFHRKASSERETKKRKPPVRLPVRLLAHMRRWAKNGQSYVVEFNGEPIKTSVEKAFKAACRDAGLPDVVPHHLRHTAATWLMQRGVTLNEASDFLGMTHETLLRVYHHSHPDYQKNAADAITRKA
jgi:integrase